jgi:glycerol-3-phosphate dehydrogenase
MAVTSAGRDAALEAARRQTFDVLVVGGGIVGAGIARDAALRGFRVALVEQHDLASGTSSRPTRLIHGGLRYLEIYDFGLVREDLKEREILLRLAPHLVFPLPFLLPQYGRRRLYQTKLRAGMQLYDLLSFDKSLPSRRWLNREAVLAAEPGINPDGLQGAWRYYDAQVPLVERLVVENALDAAANGATILTHTRVERFRRDPGEGPAVTGAVVRDSRNGVTFEVRARLTVNATGPWLDRTDGEVRPGRPPLLRLTKGVHLVTPPGTRHAHVLFSQTDGRLFFVVPWLGQSLVGTTDTDYEGDPGAVAADAADVAYLTASARQAFPAAPFDHVYYTWAGVRALGRVEGVREGQVSRKHRLLDHQEREGLPGLVSVVGGKITAYRGIAEEVGDLLSRRLGRETASYTDRRPFPGAALGSAPDVEAYVEREVWPRAAGMGLTRTQAGRLGRIYGSLAQAVLDLAEADRTLARPVAPGETAIRAELARAVGQEWATSLADVLLRRSDLGLRPDQGLAPIEAIAAALGEICGWDASERAAQIAAYLAELAPMRRLSREPLPGAGAAVPVTQGR